jgi:hypothetical protein
MLMLIIGGGVSGISCASLEFDKEWLIATNKKKLELITHQKKPASLQKKHFKIVA